MDPLPLTFGVEIEFNWACRFDDSLSKDYEFLRITDADAEQFYKRPQDHRNIGQIAKILRVRGLDVVPCTHEAHPGPGYSQWHITTDASVHTWGLDEVLRQRQVAVGSSEGWFILGSELVSRVLPAPAVYTRAFSTYDPSLHEIHRYVTALKGDGKDEFASFVNDSCGLHVHIGLDPQIAPNGLPLDVLQHLSYIIFQYEGLISRFHPIERRGYHGMDSYVSSNLQGLRNSGHLCDSIPPQTLEAIQDRIFAPDMTVQKLAALMDQSMENFEKTLTRYKFISFAYLERDRGEYRKSAPKTLEFRQHAGSLNPDDIGLWIIFVTRLVRAAERKAQQSRPNSPSSGTSATGTSPPLPSNKAGNKWPRKEGSKHKITCPNSEAHVNDLFELLELTRFEEEYWLGRLRMFAAEEFMPESHCPYCIILEDDTELILQRRLVQTAHYSSLLELWEQQEHEVEMEEQAQLEGQIDHYFKERRMRERRDPGETPTPPPRSPKPLYTKSEIERAGEDMTHSNIEAPKRDLEDEVSSNTLEQATSLVTNSCLKRRRSSSSLDDNNDRKRHRKRSVSFDLSPQR